MTRIIPCLLSAILASSAFAAHDMHQKMMCGDKSPAEVTKKMGEREDKFLKKLDLSDDQKKKVSDSRATHDAKMTSMLQELRTAHQDFMAALEKGATREELREKQRNVEAKQQALMNEKFEAMLDVRDTLTPAQKQKLVAKAKEEHKDMCD